MSDFARLHFSYLTQFCIVFYHEPEPRKHFSSSKVGMRFASAVLLTGEAFVGKLLLNLAGFATCQRRDVLRWLSQVGLFQAAPLDRLSGA